MSISGDVVDLDLGQPEGSDAGYLHPVVVITAQLSSSISPDNQPAALDAIAVSGRGPPVRCSCRRQSDGENDHREPRVPWKRSG